MREVEAGVVIGAQASPRRCCRRGVVCPMPWVKSSPASPAVRAFRKEKSLDQCHGPQHRGNLPGK
jgi:hypothetical protein